MADWGGLPGGVVALFAKRLQLIEDFIAFRSTCSSWRKATSLSDFDKSCPRLPLVLLHKSDEKRWDYIYESPSEVDEVDENTQIHSSDDDDDDSSDFEDYSDDDDENYSEYESDEIIAYKVNIEDIIKKNTQIHSSDDEDSGDDEDYSDEEDYSDDESDETVADEVNCENDKVDENDDIHESEEIKENYESDEEKSEIDENPMTEIEEENTDTDTDENSYDSEEIKDHKEIVADEVNFKNGKGDKNDDIDESTGNEVNSETHDDSESGEEKSVTSDTDDYYLSAENYDSPEQGMFFSAENYVSPEQGMFFSLSKEKGCMILLPEAVGMECRGSKGWLIMVECTTDNMCLFHPLTRARITLPEAPPEVDVSIYTKKTRSAVLSASPSETSDYVVMVAAYATNFFPGSYVGYWKPGNQTWTKVELEAPDFLGRCVEDLTYYNGKFYALTWRSEVWMCDLSGPNPKNKAVKIIELPWKWSRPRAQLVECGGRLLIVAPFFRYHPDMKSYHDLKMVELDVISGSYSTITSLGSSTVFLGHNEGFSVDANQFPPGIIEPNRIYFSDRSYRIASRGRDNVPRPDLGLGSRGVWINF